MIILAVEDDLSESVARKLLCEAGYDNSQIRCTGKRGFGALHTKLGDLLAASKKFLVLLLVDLDLRACAPTLVSSWLGKREVPQTFLFRVAVREIEAWLLADRVAFAEFIGVPESRIERNTEEIADPKRKLLDLARRGKRGIRAGLLPRRKPPLPKATNTTSSCANSSIAIGRARARPFTMPVSEKP